MVIDVGATPGKFNWTSYLQPHIDVASLSGSAALSWVVWSIIQKDLTAINDSRKQTKQCQSRLKGTGCNSKLLELPTGPPTVLTCATRVWFML